MTGVTGQEPNLNEARNDASSMRFAMEHLKKWFSKGSILMKQIISKKTGRRVFGVQTIKNYLR